MMDKKTTQAIVRARETYSAPDGKEHSVISLKAVAEIARDRNLPMREIEITALAQGIVPKRYLRNIGTIGQEGQMKLLRSVVAVAGAGGLGGIIIELLARQGIGHIIIIDADSFAETDLNRQLMSTESDLNEPKVLAAARRVSQINSAVTTTTHVARITEENAGQLIKDAQVVIDGLDNLPSRFAVEKACREMGIPFVHGAIAGFRGQLMTIFPEDDGLTAIYGPPESLPERGIELGLGNPSATPTMVAAWQVQETVKIFTGIGTPLRNRLLLMDAREGTTDEMQFGPG